MTQMMPLILVVSIIAMLRVRCIGEELGDIIGQGSLRCLIGEHVVLTWVALPILCVLSELIVLKILRCKVILLLAIDCVLLIIVVILLIVILVVEVVFGWVGGWTWLRAGLGAWAWAW